MNADPFADPSELESEYDTPSGKPNKPQPFQPSNPEDMFGNNAPAFKFEHIGDMHQGEIVGMEVGQQRSFDDGSLLFWEDGNPRKQVIFTIQTEERSAEIDDDDGQRNLYCKMPSGMSKALSKAFGKNKPAVGGNLAIKYTHNGPMTRAKGKPPKEYKAIYTPPGNGNIAHGLSAASLPPNAVAVPKPPLAENPLRRVCWEEFNKRANLAGPKTADRWLAMLNSVRPGVKREHFTDVDWNIVREAIRDLVQADGSLNTTVPDDGIPV